MSQLIYKFFSLFILSICISVPTMAQAEMELLLSSTHDVDNEQITYTFTATNVGDADAHDVYIWDGIPNARWYYTKHYTLINMSQSGFGPTIDPNDTAPVHNVVREDWHDIDFNGDGDKTDKHEQDYQIDLSDVYGIEYGRHNWGVFAKDSILAPGASISMTYTIQYHLGFNDSVTETLTPETLLGNTGYVTADLDNDSTTPDGFVYSNTNVHNVANEPILSITRGQATQINRGGVVSTLHRVSNTGTGIAFIDLDAISTRSDWGHQIWINSGSNTTEFDSTPNDLSGSGFTMAYDEDGNPTTRAIEDYGIEIQGGDNLFIVLRTQAPYSAAVGQTNRITINIIDQGNVIASNENNFQVSETVIDFKKSVSLDADCSGNSDANLGPDIAFNDQYAQTLPNNCVVWQIVATNFGTAPVQDLRVIAIAPTFSTYVAGSIRACKGNAGVGLTESCVFNSLTDTSDGDEAEEDSGSIMLNFGTGGGSILPTGVLQPGESVTVRYGTRS